MSTQLIDQMIQIQDGKITLSADVFPNQALHTLLNTFNDKQPLVIEEAVIVSREGSKLTAKGKLSFMGTSGDVTANFENTGRSAAFILQFLSSTTKVSLPSLISKSALVDNVIPDLPIDEITIRSDDQQQLTIEARITTPWSMESGPVPLTVHDIQFKLMSKGQQAFEATLKGQLNIANSTTEFIYTMPGQFDVSFKIPEIDLSRLIEEIANGIQLPWPSAFSLMLPSSRGQIKLINESLSLHITTNISGLGEFLLSVFKVEQEWAVAVLINLETTRLSSIPGLQSLAPIDSFAALSGLILYNSSKELDSEALQTMIQGILPSTKLPDRKQVLDKGLSILTAAAAIQDPMFRLLTGFLKLDMNEASFTVSVSLPDPTANSSIYLPFSAEIQAGTSMDGRLGGLIRAGIVHAFLAGSVHTEIQTQPVDITVEGTVFPNGFLISGVYLGTIHFDPLPLQLSNLALMIGLSAQGVPSFGFAGAIDIQGWDSSVALFINSAQPTQCMVAGSVSSLTLNDVVQLIMGQPLPDALGQVLGGIGLKGLKAFTLPAALAESLQDCDYRSISQAFDQYGKASIPLEGDKLLLVESKESSEWSLTDMTRMIHYRLFARNGNVEVELQPQLYFVPQETHIGSLQFPQGFHLKASIDHLFLRMQIQIEASPNQGVSGKAQVDPIIVHDRDFFSITGEGDQGPLFSFATFSRPYEADPILRDPHILVIGDIRILGLDVIKTKVLVQPDGFSFSFVSQPFIQQLDWNLKIETNNKVTGEGKLTAGISETLDAGPLGRTDVNVQVHATIRFSYQDGSATASLEGGFDIFGIQCTIPTFELSINSRTLPDLATTIWAQVSEIVFRLLHTPEQWLKLIRDGILQGVSQAPEQLGKLLAEVHKISAEDIAAKTKEILNYGPEMVTKALAGANIEPNNMLPLLKGVGFSTEDITAAIGSVFPSRHVDSRCCHMDTPAGPHADQNIHGDTPEVRTNVSLHTDVPAVHTDKRHLGVHIDITVTPHLDTQQHTDIIVTPHIDTNAHADSQLPPHADTDIHVDTGNH